MSGQQTSLRFVGVALLGIVGCGGGGPDSPSGPDDPDPPVGPVGTLDCEIGRYPCSLSGVPLAVLERSNAVADSARALMADGGTMAAIAASLRSRSGMAEVDADEHAVRFRLDGGRAVWILRESVFATRGSQPPPARVFTPMVARDVVAAGRKQKKALVLAPFLWQFGEFDDGAAVTAILERTRGYENGVTFLANADFASSTVRLSSFTNWDAYQVIHVSTHGKRLCAEGRCQAVIFATALEGEVGGTGTAAVQLQQITFRGVEIGWAENSGYTYLMLTADFFRDHYPDGLGDTFIFLNACQVHGPLATDLVGALHTGSNVVFGWDEAVLAADATAAAVALYENLADRGYPAEIAFERLGTLRTGEAAPDHDVPHLLLTPRSDGRDLRIRDVITLLDPVTAQPLLAGSRIPIEGTADDGEPDAAPWLVRVDGVVPERAATMSVRVTIDGTEGEPVALSTGEVDDEDRWMVRGLVQLPYDLTDDRTVPFRARTNLHSGGESDDDATGTLTGAAPLMGYTWQFEATHTSGWDGGVPHTPYTATARLTLEFQEGQDFSTPQPRYVVTGGDVTYDYNHTYYSCSYSAPVVTFGATPENTAGSALIFEIGTALPSYRGLLHTQGPSFTVTESCEEGQTGTRTHAATNIWLRLDPGQALPFTDDGLITGSYRNETGNGFYHQSDYTIRRVR